jgi:hypothetical protein
VIDFDIHPDPNGWYVAKTVTPEALPTLYYMTRR